MSTPSTINSDSPRVAFQGELGAFSEEAVAIYFRDCARPIPRRQFTDVADAVVKQEAEFGLLPIENTTVGAVTAAYDALGNADLNVVGEVICPVRHCVLGLPGAQLRDLRKVLSHPVALAQCSVFFARHTAIEPVATYDTAGAAKQVALQRDRAVGAVAGQRAADRYELVVLAHDIQDRSDNQTRFLIVARPGAVVPVNASGEAKTALLLETQNTPGSLVAALLPFALRGVNLASLQSRPGKDPWTYRFFLEMEGAAQDASVAQAIEEVSRSAVTLRVLGSFPKWGSISSVERGAAAQES
jgi:prephenate dehydratase